MNRLYATVMTLALLAVPVLCAPAMGGGPGLVGTSLPANFTAFAPDSPWNTPIGPNPRLAPDSRAMIARLKAKAGHLKADMEKWSVPLYVINSKAVPLHTVLARKEAFHPSVDPDKAKRAQVPLPDGVRPDPERDGHMLLVDPALRRAWDLSRAETDSRGRWSATRVAVWDLDGPGFDPPFKGSRWWMRGARGSGMPLIGGLIRPEQIRAGKIAHALSCAMPVCRGSVTDGGPKQLCSPMASRTDGRSFGPDTIPEGARIQLDPNLDLDSLGLNREVKIVARALQVYGAYLCDQGPTFKLYLQNLGPGAAAWRGLDFRGLSRIPVDRFRVLDCELAEK